MKPLLKPGLRIKSAAKCGVQLTLRDVLNLKPDNKVWYVYTKDGYTRLDQVMFVESVSPREITFTSGYDFELERAMRNVHGDPSEYPAEVESHPGETRLYAVMESKQP